MLNAGLDELRASLDAMGFDRRQSFDPDDHRGYGIVDGAGKFLTALPAEAVFGAACER